ncbi:MAG: hypothetical protein EPN45_08345 [Rhizobiaceae bacterium]|nr:MAG: hypothetical protein EPN45_08345 [Rhizobiaceae bacterium]
MAPIKKLAEEMGVESPLSGHKTMVLGTSGMTVMDQATGYSVFADGGFADERHGITELLSRIGKVVYDHDEDAPKPKRVLSDKVVAEMNYMLSQVTERGTGRRALLPMARIAGKTGTTQDYRDAWFVGFTGNYVCAVWIGNDDYTPMKRVVGGFIPAMIWQRVMSYANQNVDIKPIPGLPDPLPDPKIAGQLAKAEKKDGDAVVRERPRILSSATTEFLRELSEALKTAPPLKPPARPETLSSL